MKISLKQLEVFVAIAKSENMSQAAQALYITQSACSMALATLENQLDGALFNRYGKQLILNERGRVFWPKAANILAQVKELQDLMLEGTTQNLSGHLIVGASTTIGNYLIPEIIGKFLNDYPNTKISLQVSNTEQIIQQLLQYKIDIGFIEGQCYINELHTTAWRNDELIIIAHPKHPLYKKTKITIADLYTAKWIVREAGSGTREKFEEAIGGAVQPFIELGHTEAIKQAVTKGLGISCVSKLTVMDALKKGTLVQLDTRFLKLSRKFFIVIHKKKYQTKLLTEFFKRCNQYENLSKKKS